MPALWADNVFVERLWRSLKYECTYLHAYGSVGEAPALGAQTPDQVYFHRPPEALAA
jgi:hypothetical protein